MYIYCMLTLIPKGTHRGVIVFFRGTYCLHSPQKCVRVLLLASIYFIIAVLFETGSRVS